MTAATTLAHARTGDWLQVSRPGGAPPRRGQILEVLGEEAHLHFRVRWDEAHESLFYPEDGVTIVKQARR